MTTKREQIEALARDMEAEAEEAYARGWRDAIAALQEKAPQPARPITAQEGNGTGDSRVQRGRGRPEKAISLVRQTIESAPGLRGVDVSRRLATGENPVSDRTVRSALRRLRNSRVIWQRKGKWYPKSQDTGEVEHDNGEVLGIPPH